MPQQSAAAAAGALSPLSPRKPSFEDLLSQLRQAHEHEIWQLRKQVEVLRVDHEQVIGKAHERELLEARKQAEVLRADCERGSGKAALPQSPSRWHESCEAQLALRLPASRAVLRASVPHSYKPIEDDKPVRPRTLHHLPDVVKDVEFEASAATSATLSRDAKCTTGGEEHGPRDVGACKSEPSGRCATPSASVGAERSVSSAVKLAAARSRRRRAIDSIEPKLINFQSVTSERYGPGRTWEDLNTKEKVTILVDKLEPRHCLISPQSVLIKCWDAILAAALAFVGLVTPFEVVFLPHVHWGFFVVNRAVDFVFALDIVLQFFLQVEIQRPQRGGSILLRDPLVLRCRYLKSWFMVDLVSIFPFDVLSIAMADSSPFWRRVKIVRCLRLMRLAKLLRMVRGWKLQQRWRNAIGIQFGTQKLLRFCTVLMLVSHWMACIWGLTGLTLGAELCDREGRLIDFGGEGVGIDEVSWVTILYNGGKISPDTPCNPFEVYVAALHWAVMTLTSIGYGDIVPVRVEEYIVGIFCMIVGGVLWAYVIGSVCSIISNVSPVEKNFETNTDLLNLTMEEARVPHEERHEYREYLREAKAYDRRICFRQVAENFSPMLRKHLLYHAAKGALNSVYYFDDPDAPLAFLMDVASCLIPRFFSRFESLDYVRQCLCFMDRGTVAHCGLILVHPSAFNEDFIITQRKYQKEARTVSLTYTQLLVLTRSDLEEVLDTHPQFARKIWRCAFKRAFCRAVQLTAAAYRTWQATMPSGSKLSLGAAFDKFRDCGDFEEGLDRDRQWRVPTH